MQSETYRGFSVWGHAIKEQQEILEHERYAASGTVTRDGKFVQASGILAVLDSEADAENMGLEWARAWVDSHG
ncbi:hypothetical protein [Paraburkholderia sp. A1RO-5L]|uniref:hypothetical protein n=2 Tax=unclassified Paraburkholderia TaxID=2615204 RepID=UPI003B8059B0